MQRRAAAMYFAFFVVVGAAAYGLIATTSAPHVSLDAQEYSQGEEIVLNDRSYAVEAIESESGGGGGGHGGGGGATITGELSWVNESAVITTTLDNGSEVPVTDVTWENQRARGEATLEAGSTISYNGSEYDVSVNGSAGSVTLARADDPSVNETHEAGDTFTFRGYEATVTNVESGAATLVWGGPYLLDIQTDNVTNPTEATFIEQRDIEALAQRDPALYNETIVQDGVRKVTFRNNDTNVAVTEYFGTPETHTIEEGGTLVYQGNETTVDAVENESVTLTRPGQETESVELSEGGNFTVGGEQYFAHFPDNESVQVLSASERYDEYRAQNNEIDSYHQRMNGLWGVLDISALAAIILLATAYLPVRG